MSKKNIKKPEKNKKSKKLTLQDLKKLKGGKKAPTPAPPVTDWPTPRR